MRLFVSALEPSANIHLRSLALQLNAVAQRNDTIYEIVGIFDREVFKDCDCINAQAAYNLSDFAAMGFIDVIKKVFFYKRINQEMIQVASACQKALLIDSSSFHIPLAKGLAQLKHKPEVIYYILPQVWAWKSWRAKLLERICDRLCATLPFELNLYPNAMKQQKIHYVGHPLLDELGITNAQSPNTESFTTKPLVQRANGGIVFMPGSRKGEIKRVFPLFAMLAKEFQGIQKILVLPEHFRTLNQNALKTIYGADIESFQISFDATHELTNCRFAFICSGTATLQAALLQTPFVLVYRMRKLEFYIARAFVRLNVIGLANILYQASNLEVPGRGESRLHEELIQDDLSVENLLQAYKRFDFAAYKQKSARLISYLKHGSSQNIAEILARS